MNAELFASLDLLEKESGISKEYMLAKIEEALANACRKEVGATALIRVNLDPVKCDMKVYHRRLVVPDGESSEIIGWSTKKDATKLQNMGLVTTHLRALFGTIIQFGYRAQIFCHSTSE